MAQNKVQFKITLTSDPKLPYRVYVAPRHSMPHTAPARLTRELHSPQDQSASGRAFHRGAEVCS